MDKRLNILFTGSSGFIGRRLYKYLDNFDKFNIFKIENFYSKDFKNNFLNYEINSSIMDNINIVIHLANKAHSGFIYKKKYLKNLIKLNYYKTIELADIAKEKKVDKFIFVSSIKVLDIIEEYDYPNNFKINSLKTSNIYSYIKKITENKLLKIFKNSDTELIILRPSAVYGLESKGIFSKIEKLLKFMPIIFVPNLNIKKNLLHVYNLIQFIEIIISNQKNKIIYHLSDKNLYSLKNILDAINQKYKRKIYYLNFLNKIFLFKPFKNIFKFFLTSSLSLTDDDTINDINQFELNNIKTINNYYD